jgi:hypothetical protein
VAHRQHHRGPHPDDARLFGPDVLPLLRRAAEELTYLLTRGYPLPSALELVGNHHQLGARQRTALQRACCSREQRAARGASALPPSAVAGHTLQVDGFNVLVTLEVALGGGVVLVGAEGALRDLAGMRGSYHPVDETDAALTLLGTTLAPLAPAAVEFYLDTPVSNSARLRARIEEHGARWGFPVRASLVPDPDAVLAGRSHVASSDAAVLDACASWVNLAAWVLDACAQGVWRVDLAGGGAPAK